PARFDGEGGHEIIHIATGGLLARGCRFDIPRFVYNSRLEGRQAVEYEQGGVLIVNVPDLGRSDTHTPHTLIVDQAGAIFFSNAKRRKWRLCHLAHNMTGPKAYYSHE